MENNGIIIIDRVWSENCVWTLRYGLLESNSFFSRLMWLMIQSRMEVARNDRLQPTRCICAFTGSRIIQTIPDLPLWTEKELLINTCLSYTCILLRSALRLSVVMCSPVFQTNRYLDGVVVCTLDLRISVAGSVPSHDTALLFLRWPYCAGELSWDITTTQVNSALQPSAVAKSSTSFGWSKGGKLSAAGWSHMAYDFP